MAGQTHTERYRDLDLDFIAHPVTGDIVQKVNKESIKQSVKNLVRMGRFDKPFQPHIDSKIRRLLFEPDTPLTKVELRKSIFDVLKRHEPRIILHEVQILYDMVDNSYNITLRYQILNQPNIENISIQLERLR
jgi:phage baseplate assembly protein W